MSQFSSRPMVVEFIGTPGAGKTACLPVVKDFFTAHGFHAWSVLEAARPFAKRTKIGRLVDSRAPVSLKSPLLWQVFYQASKIHRATFRSENKELLNSVLDFQHTRPIPRSDRHHVLHWFINLTGQYRFLKEHAKAEDVFIFDEGFIHRVVQLFASEAETLDEARITSYLSMVPVPDLIISPQASLETCLERVYRRGIWERFQDRDIAYVFRFMANAHEAVNIAMDYIRKQSWPLIQVPNEYQSTAETAQQLRQKLADQYTPIPQKVSIPFDV